MHPIGQILNFWFDNLDDMCLADFAATKIY